MKGLAISYKGMEDITELEINELLKTETEAKGGCVVFDVKDMKDLAVLSYKGQGVNRVLLLLEEFEINSIEDLQKKVDISEYGKSFAVRTKIIENKLDRKEAEIAVAEKIDGKVDLDNPDVVVFVYIYGKNAYIGIDFSGDLSKRDYKIATTRDDLRGTIAYALVRLSGYSSEKSFLNLNAKTGTIAIEAALFGSGLSINHYNKTKFPFLKFMKSQKGISNDQKSPISDILNIDLGKFDSEMKEVKVYAYDSSGYRRVVEKNAKVAGVKINLVKSDGDCVVKYSRGMAEIKNLKEEREIKHGREILKIATFKNP